MIRCLILIALGTAQGGLLWAAPPEPVKEFPHEVGPESAAQREARHRQVAERRAGPIVIAHRGAAAFAPENTLEAYAAAMDYGADGCEVDLRRSRDGVLLLFHDDMLDHLTDGFGAVNQLTYRELLALRPQTVCGRPIGGAPPTFAALLDLARQRAMLLHLDLKEPGLEKAIAHQLDAADAWDQVVAVNTANATNLLTSPKLKLLRYKAPGLYEGRLDVDPDSVKRVLAQAGEMIMVDDPRVAARALGRAPYRPVPLIKSYRLVLRPAPASPLTETNTLLPMGHLRALARRLDPASVAQLVSLIEAPFPAGAQPEGDLDYQNRRTARILERAWAAQRLGELGHKSARVAGSLERLVRQRSLHGDWRYHGLDGALAARALGKLGATDSVAVLVEAFRRVDPALRQVANPNLAQYPLAWTDFRFKMYILPALGDLRCGAAKKFLREYIALDEAGAREWGPPQFEEATKALLCQGLAWDELAALLRGPNLAVRGTAILECLDRHTEERLMALKAAVPWALELPRAKGWQTGE